MLINPAHPMYDWPAAPSAIARMWADWCVKQGARVEVTRDGDFKYVEAYVGGTAESADRVITAEFDAIDGRFTRDGSVGTEYEFGSATSLKELANALLTGRRGDCRGGE